MSNATSKIHLLTAGILLDQVMDLLATAMNAADDMDVHGHVCAARIDVSDLMRFHLQPALNAIESPGRAAKPRIAALNGVRVAI